MADLELITTADGSHSLFNRQLDETYHSVHGALRESIHVFIDAGLHHVLARPRQNNIRILEIGFGTGLNALLTAKEIFGLSVNVEYVSLEAFPLNPITWSVLNFPSLMDYPTSVLWFKDMHEAKWDVAIELTPNFRLLKQHTTLQQWNNPGLPFDLIYYDAFAPAKQPDMWTLNILQKTVGMMKLGAVFVTYCAKGQLKRDLKSLGLVVETLPGPPGKAEMVRATWMETQS